ncbi:hypothetical protein [Novosphingobium aquae]|uniref:Uncharacterized protein n=1 Tax=Novosphingobium aquae TaxID=3133435 RepID=A0ABU8SE86_9SPHN
MTKKFFAIAAACSLMFVESASMAAAQNANADPAASDAAEKCVTLTNRKGKWRLDDAGKWAKCKGLSGAEVGGGSNLLPAVLAVGGLGAVTAAVASSGRQNGTVSP